ncbi:hypothetical protein LAZ67_5002211 [Cordylochernes scorpioides]|uniref:CCHC-type domain-containing protein n=1 Tax=Cordylochernes scorpioides TaxID=51811 RepID=A0ABY6KI28_9ARAC|nr:hypothetical protein LAZ67_5002211 [Cordylochernes scorpioides]
MTEWHRVVFSDESRFCLSSDSRRVRVWRRRGERSNPAAIVERPTVRQRGIMVWGAILYDSRSPLLRIQGIMTAQRYVDDVLRPVTLPYLQGVPNALYQHDNARPHTARISQQALQDVQMLPWPPYSPDLSPIEHVWDIIGRRLHALPQPRSEDELWQMVEREWRAIPQDAIRTLIDSLPRRVASCIAVRDQKRERPAGGRERGEEKGNAQPMWGPQGHFIDDPCKQDRKFRIISILEGKDLDAILEADPPKEEEKFKELKKKDAQAKVIRGLPHKYNLIVLQLSNQEKLTIFDLRNSLKLYHERFSNDTKEENSSAFKVYKCFICHKPGHKAAECWHNLKTRKYKCKQTVASQGSSGYKANTPNKNSKATFAKDENRNDFAKLVKQQDNLEQQWILDSGASSHMTFHLDHLKNIQAMNKKITLADDSYITSESIGDVEIKNSDEESIILKDVLYVPKLSDNLISVSKLIQDKKQILFDNKGRHIQNEKGDTLLTASKIEDFYIINEATDTYLPPTPKTLKISDTSWDIWHRRLGHINEEYMKMMQNNALVHKFKCNTRKDLNCISYRRHQSTLDRSRTANIFFGLKPWMHSHTLKIEPHNKRCTPEEPFTGRKPTIGHLKIFGCLAEMWTPKHKRSKFEKITKTEIFVGYSNNRKAYRICNPQDFSITETRDVKFFETRKGSELLNQEKIRPHHPGPGFYYEPSLSDVEEMDNDSPDSSYQTGDTVLKTSHQGYSIPNCYKEAMNLPDSEKWIGAMERELDSLREHKVWTLQPLPKGSKVIKSYQQRYGQDYEEIFSPVIKNDSLRVILAFAAIMQYDIKCFDIVTAYLYGNLEETIYMKQPEGFEDFASDANKEEMKMRLNRMQQWNEPAIRFAEDILVLCNKVDPPKWKKRIK